MDRHLFEDRKRRKLIIKSKENLTLIGSLNMYGRVPEPHELLNEIKQLKNILNKLTIYINNLYNDEYISYGTKEEILNIIRGEDNE